MKTLVNTLNREQALKKIWSEADQRLVLSFYRYVKLDQPHDLRDKFFIKWSELGVLGRIYLAEEGINAQLSLPQSNFKTFIKLLDEFTEFKDIPLQVAVEQKQDAFLKLTIKVKKQIVADGLPIDTYDLSQVGQHLDTAEFNEALERPDTIVVDIRNHYESRIGRFEKAITPDCDTFREELPMVRDLLKGKEDKKILLYCTGGIRCEKASAYLKHHGFQDVNQLSGGIINYAHEVRQKGLESKFKGKNFVFDERLGEKITDDILTTCDQCHESCDDYTNCAWESCNLLFIQCRKCRQKFDNCCSFDCQKKFHLPAAEKIKLRLRQKPTNYKIFKSRQRPNLKF